MLGKFSYHLAFGTLGFGEQAVLSHHAFPRLVLLQFLGVSFRKPSLLLLNSVK